MPATTSTRLAGWVLLGLAVLAHLYALYDPSPGGSQLPVSDKLVHVLLFGVPTAVGRLIGLGRWWPVLLALHAPVSELVQARVLPTRSGDPLDVVADLVGVVLALVLVRVVSGPPSRW